MTIESTAQSAEERAENVYFLCRMTRRKYEGLIKTAQQLQAKVISNE